MNTEETAATIIARICPCRREDLSHRFTSFEEAEAEAEGVWDATGWTCVDCGGSQFELGETKDW